jgi:cellulose synthase operon protein C
LPGAIVQLKNAIQADQKMLAAHVLLGKALLRSGDPVGAEVEFDEALKQGVSRAEVITLLGQSYLQQSKYDTLLERATPGGLPLAQQVDVLVLRANAQAETANISVALKTLDEARGLDPRSVSVRLAQATLSIRKGDLTLANKLTDDALSLAPNDAAAWHACAGHRSDAGNGLEKETDDPHLIKRHGDTQSLNWQVGAIGHGKVAARPGGSDRTGTAPSPGRQWRSS